MLRQTRRTKQKQQGRRTKNRKSTYSEDSQFDSITGCFSSQASQEYLQQQETNTHKKNTKNQRKTKSKNKNKKKKPSSTLGEPNETQCQYVFQEEQCMNNGRSQLTEQLDFQIKDTMKSYFRTQNIPDTVVLNARRQLVEQIEKLMGKVIQRHIAMRNKTHLLHLKQFLKVINEFDEKYKNKMIRTIMMQKIDLQTHRNHH